MRGECRSQDMQKAADDQNSGGPLPMMLNTLAAAPFGGFRQHISLQSRARICLLCCGFGRATRVRTYQQMEKRLGPDSARDVLSHLNGLASRFTPFAIQARSCGQTSLTTLTMSPPSLSSSASSPSGGERSASSVSPFARSQKRSGGSSEHTTSAGGQGRGVAWS